MAINAAMSVLSPKVGAAGRPVDWTLDPNGPIPFALGRVGVAGSAISKGTFGPDKMNFGAVSVISGAGPIDGYESYTADDLLVTFDANGKCVTPEWNGELFRVQSLGNQPDTWLRTPIGLKNNSVLPNWTASHRASGKALSFHVMVENSKGTAFPNGEIKPRIVLRGVKCWDPRKDSTYPGGNGPQWLNSPSTWAWSDNPAILALRWILGMWEDGVGKGAPHVGQQVGGIGSKLSGIDMPAYVAAANVCDTNGWTAAAYPNTDDDKHQVLVGLLQAAGAIYSQRAGKISLIQRASPKTSVATITANDVIGAIEIDTAASRIDRINTIQPQFWSPQHRWQMTALPEVTAQAYRDADGGKRSRGVTYAYVTNANQAAQLAALEIAHAREGMAGQIVLKPYLQRIQPGDTFVIDEPGFLLDGQKFLCMSTEYDPAEAVVRVTFVSETDAKYPFALGQSTTPPAPPTLVAREPVSPPLPEDWVIVPRPPAQDGSQTPGFDLEGVVSNAMATAVIVEWGPAATGPWTQAYAGPPTVTRIPIVGVQAGATYYIAVQYQIENRFSERMVYGPYIAPTSIASDVLPTGPNVLEILQGIETERDLAIASATTAIEQTQAQFNDALNDVEDRVDSANAALTQTQNQFNDALSTVQDRVDGVWAVVGETDEEGLRQTVIDILENGTGGAGLTELTTRVEGVEQVVNATGNQALARKTDLTELETSIAGTYAKTTQINDLTSRVSGVEGVNTAQNTRLNTVETDLAGKASSTSVTNLSSEVTSARNGSASLSAQLGTMRQTVTDGLAGKASASDLTTLTARVTGVEGVNTAQNTRLNTVETDLTGKASATSVNELQAQTRSLPNLIVNGDFADGFRHWERDGAGPASDAGFYLHHTLGSIAWLKGAVSYICTDFYPVSPGDPISLSLNGDRGGGDGSACIQWFPGYQQVGHVALPQDWGVRAKSEGNVAPAGATSFRVVIAKGTATQVHAARVKVNYGWTATNWSDEATVFNNNARIQIVETATTDNRFASASSLTNLTARVTSAEGVNTAQNTRLNTVESDVAGKASSTSVSNLSSEITSARNGSATLSAQLGAMRQTVTDGLAGKASATDLVNLTTRVTSAEGVNSAQNTRLNTVESDVAGKASATSVTNLTSTVTNNNNTLTAKIGNVSGTVADALAGKASASSYTVLEARLGGEGGNLLQNTDFEGGLGGWSAGGQVIGALVVNPAGDDWRPSGENCIGFNVLGAAGYSDIVSANVSVESGKWYDVAVYVATHRAAAEVYIGWVNSAGAAISYVSGPGAFTPGSGGRDLNNFTRRWFKAQAPAGATQAFLIIRKYATNTGSDSWMWMTRPMFGQCADSTPGPRPFQHGSSRNLAASITDARSVAISAKGAIDVKVGVILNANGKISGFSSTNNGTSSTFDVQADVFRLTNGATTVSPFTVSGNTVFMNNVMIRSGPSGERMELTPSQLRVYDSNNVLRVRIGLW